MIVSGIRTTSFSHKAGLFARVLPPRLAVITGLLMLTANLFAGVVLQPASTPGTATAGNTVTVTGTGFPAGTIPATSVSVTLTPPSGNGAPVTIQSTGVTTIGSSRSIKFVVPAGIVANSPLVCSVSVAGSNPSAYTTTTPASLTINPTAAVNNLSPGAGQRGNAIPVTISGRFTTFGPSSTITIGNPGGIVVSNVNLIDTTHISALFTIAANATPGARSITVTTGNEVATIGAGFIVSANPGQSFTSITPAFGQQGQTLNVALTGVGTSWDNTSFVSFGDGITVNSLSGITATTMTANVTVSPLTYTGIRAVTVVTNTDFTLSGSPGTPSGFTVTTAGVSISTVTPNSSPQSSAQQVTVLGVGTHFLQNATTLSFGNGINVGNTRVNSPTSVTVDLAIGPGATVGFHDVSVTTGGETATLLNGYTVTSSTPFLSNVTPTSGLQGSTVVVNVTGVNTGFAAGLVSADFGSNIATSVLVNSATSVSITATIGSLANVGSRNVILRSGGTDFTFQFTVNQPVNVSILSVTPASGPQGSSPTLTVTGQNTHWVQGTTSVTITTGNLFSLTVNRITVTSSTSALLDITIPANAPVGGYSLTMTTGGEVVSAGFGVSANTPTLSIAPGSGKIGTTIPVNLTGDFTSFVAGTTTLNISGAGIAINNFTVVTAASAKANLVIDPTAPLGGRTVTMTTGTQVVTTSFVVTSTPAMLLSISPASSPRSTTLNIDITGQNTSFAQGTTTVGLGPNVTVNSVTVNSTTSLRANITIDAVAAFGWRTVFVNTGAEQLQIGFKIESPGAPIISNAVNPSSGLQGQTLTGVSITGVNTHWVQGTTQLFLGAGVTVLNLSVTGPTSMLADISISPTAPVGGSTLITITGAEIAGGTGFTVYKGAYQILSLTPNVVAQNQTLSVSIVGQATHWLQGGTVADFGPGISVDSLTINTATSATAVITILSQAAVGLRSVTLSTSGETASINNGLDVQQGTPTLLSSTPNSGLQGEVKTIFIQGRFTHFGPTTQAAYSPGITVNSVSAADSANATLSITIDPLAYVDYGICRTLTVTTGAEQVSLPNQFCVGSGPAQITSVSPASTPQGSTQTLTVVGQNTHWQAGVTTATVGAGVNVAAVHVLDATHATVDIAATVNAPTGLKTVTLTTLGEIAYMNNAYTVTPGVPTLNGISPTSLQQGQTQTLHIIGQFTHFSAASTTATFGAGVTLNSLTVIDASTLDANITIDPLAYLGSRTVTITTGTEIVSGGLAVFSITASPAIISSVSPSSGNQGQNKILTITGQNTHWQQGLTQFSMAGAGSDITINGFIVNSTTSATVDISISPTAGLGARGVYISTAGEVLSNSGAFVVTGGIPSITYISPSSGKQGTTNLNVSINGVFTLWDSSTTVDFGPGITVVGNPVINSNTSITAVININAAATLGYNTVTVRKGSQNLTSSFLILTSVVIPPTPYISYFTPSSGLPGQTFSVSIAGQFTKWDLTTGINFGAGVHVNSYQTVTPTSALANITIDPTATAGTRTVTMTTTTNGEVDTTYFSVVIATPFISIVDPGSALQGETGKDVNVIGQFTNWNNTTTFNFGSGVTVNSVNVLGPGIATVNVAVSLIAQLGGRSVTATTGAHVDSGGGFSVTPSLANISAVAPNTALQNDTPTVTVTGQFTHFVQGSTVFSFGGYGITVTSATVTDSTHATLILALAPLATLGNHSLTATTGGENASLGNAFVVQPGTPLILSTAPQTIQQQNGLHITILGQFTNWTQGTTSISFGAGSGIAVGTTTVTSAEGITADITASATTPLGYRTLFVTTGAQVLTYPNAIYVTNGPAAISGLTPPTGLQGQTSLNVSVLGTNTNFVNGTTTANFGAGISVNGVTVTDATHATVNITIAASAVPGNNGVTLTTLGETAGNFNFLIGAATPVIQIVSPNSGNQGDSGTVLHITSSFTHFLSGTVTANFGSGVTGIVTVVDNTHADVTLTISPTATVGARNVTLDTDLGGGVHEVASKLNAFTVNAGNATISTMSPNSGRQNQVALQVTITGTGTHFTNATTVDFGSGISVTQVVFNSATSLLATINIQQFASVGTRTVTATTGGESASSVNGFTVNAGLPVVSSISPLNAHQNDTLNVQVNGLYTNFVQGVTTASFGAGVTVNGTVAVSGPNSATVNITVTPGAVLGVRAVTMTTGAEVATLASAFTVLAGTPQLSTITPVSGAQGSIQTVTVNGLFTNFVQGTSIVSFSGAGVTAGTPTVNGPGQLQVTVTVTPGASAGQRNITVTTGAEVVSLSNAFNVLPGSPSITLISPTVGVPNTVNLNVAITGQFTNFVNGTTQATFGPGISVNGSALGAYGNISVSDATHATAVITIDTAASLGARDLIVKTGVEIITVSNGFTVQSLTPTAPTVIQTSPTNGAGSVPINSSFKVIFSGPVDPATVAVTNVAVNSSVYGCSPYNAVSSTLSLDASGRILTITPNAVLAVGQTYYFSLNQGSAPYLKDPSNHTLAGDCRSFTTGFAIDNSGPAFLTSNISNGDIALGTNILPVLVFDKAVDPSTQPLGLTVAQGASPVAGTWSYNSTFTQATFNPAGGFSAATAYTITFASSLKDSVGNSLVNPGAISFTTGTGADTAGASLVSYSPFNGAVTGTNTSIHVVFNKTMNPLSMTQGQFYLYRNVDGYVLPGTVVTVSPDRKSFTLTPSSPLSPSTTYTWYFGPAYTQAQAYSGYGSVSFTTGTTADIIAPSVTSISPGNGQSSVPVNASVFVTFSEPLDSTTVTQSSVSFNPAVGGTVTLSSTGTFLTFTPTSPLASNSSYTVNVGGGLTDLSGNPLVPYSSSFSTSSTVDTTSGAISMLPAVNTTGVATNTSIVFTFTKPFVVGTVNTGNIRLYDNTSGVYVAGSISVSASATVVNFTPTAPLQPSHQYCGYAGYPFSNYIQDLAGNNFSYVYNQCFTTAAGVDNTPPTVTLMMPLNGATGVGPNNPVTLSFSKSMNPGTLTDTNIAIYIGSTLYTRSYATSFDSTSLTFYTGNLPFGTTFNVIVTPSVTDLAGNHLATQYSGTFTTAPQPVIARPSITAVRPASGATMVSSSTAITLFVSAPLNPSTVPGALHVSQNGALITGTITYSSGNQVVVFQPSSPLQAGAPIQVWLSSSATDTSSNPLYDYYQSFTVAPDYASTPASLISTSPSLNSLGAPTTALIDMQFNKVLDPATVNSGTVYILRNDVTPVAGTISLLNNNTVIRFTPSSPLLGSTNNSYYYRVHYTGFKDVNNFTVNPADNNSWYFYTSNSAISISPSVSSVAPTNGATGIGTNALIRTTFNGPLDVVSLTPANVSLVANATSIPTSLSWDANSNTLTITPQAPLPPSTPVQLSFTAGVVDASGNPLVPFSSTFTTGAAPDFSRPYVISSSVVGSQTDVPVNSVFTFTFNKPIDARTFALNNNIYLYDYQSGYVPSTLAVNPGGTQVTLVPVSLLNVNRAYQYYVCSVQDLNGNVMNSCAQISFTTALVGLSGGPQVTTVVPYNGLQTPTNFSPQIQFDRPINASVLSGITLRQGANPVPSSLSSSLGGTMITVKPNALLLPNLPYTLSITGVQDAPGNVMVGTVTRSFTTAASIDLIQPSIVSVSPVNGAATGTHPLIRVVYTEPINPLASGYWSLTNNVTGARVPGIAITTSSDLLSQSITYPGNLDPNTQYCYNFGYYYDLAGNYRYNGNQCFITGATVDNSPLSVISATPGSGQSNVPLNGLIQLVFNKVVDATTISNASLTLSPAAPAGSSVQLSSDARTLSLSLGGSLSSATTYTMSASGFQDVNGNAVTPFSSSFQTGVSVDNSQGTISLTSPAQGAPAVPVNSTITVSLTKPVIPASVTNSDSFRVLANNDGNRQLAGNVSVSPDGKILTFTPSSPLPATTPIYIYVSYFAQLRDLAGNTFSPCIASFTTASTADNTPPSVSVTPTVGATNVGPNAIVTLSFSKSLDYTTINPSNFALYKGFTNLNAAVNRSSDNRTVTLSTTLPYSSTITIVVSTNVKDISGNSLAAPFSSTFTTAPQPVTGNPSVSQMRPANGASGVASNSKITLYFNAALNAASVPGAFYVAQNGALVTGSVVTGVDGRSAVFTPNAPLAGSAYIQVFFTGALDTGGNLINSYAASFSTAPNLTTTPLSLVSTNPAQNTLNVPQNVVVDLQFSKPINPGSVDGTKFFLRQNDGPTSIPGTISFLSNNTVVRFTPTSPLTGSNNTSIYYRVHYTGFQDVDGLTLGGGDNTFYFYTNLTTDNIPPTVISAAPYDTATGIGDNSSIRIGFSKTMDTVSINSSTISLMSGATPIPYSLSFNSGATVATISPLSPLPDSATITLQLSNGIIDPYGNAIAAQSLSFQTGAGADFSGPYVIYSNIDSSTPFVPTNAAFTLVFNKPLDRSTVVPAYYYLYNNSVGISPTTISMSPDGRSVTFVPTAPLVPNQSYSIGAYYALDLNGNQQQNFSISFTTGGGTDSVSPQVVDSTPANSSTGVPVNALIEVRLNEAVSGSSLTQITLQTGGVSVPFSAGLAFADSTIRLVPANLLMPNTLYTVTIQGVQDIAGNVMAGTYSFSFTTGSNILLGSSPYFTSVVANGVPLSNANTLNVPVSPTIVVAFDTPVEPASLYNGGLSMVVENTQANVPLNIVISADHMSATITTTAPLTAATSYRMRVGYNYNVRDWAGNTSGQYVSYLFTTP